MLIAIGHRRIRPVPDPVAVRISGVDAMVLELREFALDLVAVSVVAAVFFVPPFGGAAAADSLKIAGEVAGEAASTQRVLSCNTLSDLVFILAAESAL